MKKTAMQDRLDKIAPPKAEPEPVEAPAPAAPAEPAPSPLQAEEAAPSAESDSGAKGRGKKRAAKKPTKEAASKTARKTTSKRTTQHTSKTTSINAPKGLTIRGGERRTARLQFAMTPTLRRRIELAAEDAGVSMNDLVHQLLMQVLPPSPEED